MVCTRSWSGEPRVSRARGERLRSSRIRDSYSQLRVFDLFQKKCWAWIDLIMGREWEIDVSTSMIDGDCTQWLASSLVKLCQWPFLLQFVCDNRYSKNQCSAPSFTRSAPTRSIHSAFSTIFGAGGLQVWIVSCVHRQICGACCRSRRLQ